MKTKRFTLLQLMNVIDGRISTTDAINDSKAILSHLFDTVVYDHEVPQYIQELRNYNPLWLVAIRHEIAILSLIHETRISFWDFRTKQQRYQDMIKIIGLECNYYFDVPQLIIKP